MQNAWVLASLWVGLAQIATLLAIWFKMSTTLSEIVLAQTSSSEHRLLPAEEKVARATVVRAVLITLSESLLYSPSPK